MNKQFDMLFESEFVNLLFLAEKEAERLGKNSISTFVFFKVLLNHPDTYISHFLQQVGINWSKVVSAMEKQSNLFVKSKVNEKVVPFYFYTSSNETKTFSFENDFYQTLKYSVHYASDGKTIDEITFILSIFAANMPEYIVNFLRQINIDGVLLRRYYEGITMELAADLFMESKEDDDEETDAEEEGESSEEDASEEYWSEDVQEALDEAHEEAQGIEEDESASETESNSEDKRDVEKEKSNKGDNIEKLDIPAKLQNCLKVMSVDSTKSSPILERDKEVDAVMKVLLKSKKRNCILVGKPGVGKTAIMEHLAWKIAKGDCPEELKNKIIVSFDPNAIIAGTVYRGMAEDRFMKLTNYLEKTSNIVLFIDEIHRMIGAGKTGQGDSLDLANSLKPLLTKENLIVIGATTNDEYELCFNRDKAFKRRFETVMVETPKYEKVYPMIKEQINRLEEVHNVTISRPVINFIIKIASCFNFETNNPDVSLDLIDKSMAAAKMQKTKQVTKQIVLSNFSEEFEEYKKLSEEFKTAIAYHETGHFLLQRYVVKQHKTLAVSIIPANDYLGVTVYDYGDNYMCLRNYQELVNEIARSLAGRVAEEMYTGNFSAGASSDLEKATTKAREMLVKFGLIPKFSVRNVEQDTTDKIKDSLNYEIDRIINNGYEIAKAVIREHEDVLKEIVKNLVKEGILVDEELEKICKDLESKSVIKDPEVNSI